MFEFLFKYPQAVFSRGTFVLLGDWPLWVLGLGILAAGAALGYVVWNRSSGSDRMAGALSGGMRQKLALAVVLAMETPLVILDEPTANLDPTARAEVLALVREARAAAERSPRQPAVVLLSPACASFDQFRDFEARGDAFRAIVAQLAAEASREGAAA